MLLLLLPLGLQTCDTKCIECKKPVCANGACTCEKDSEANGSVSFASWSRRDVASDCIMDEAGLDAAAAADDGSDDASCKQICTGKQCPDCQRAECDEGECKCVTYSNQVRQQPYEAS